MPKRVLIALASCVAATACISTVTPAVNYGTGSRFVPFIVDSIDDMGRGNAVALAEDGTPYVSYFGFAAELEKGEIAIPRPFGSPTVPGVMLSTASIEGLWQRGAVQMQEPPDALRPVGISVPFGPIQVNDLEDTLTREDANGTALVVTSDGTVHMAWAAGDRVDYATTKLGGTATVETVFRLPHSVAQAGPLGRPSVTVDEDGNAWVAFGVETSKGIEIHVARQDGKDWTDDVAATFASCNGCPAPQPTGIGTVGGNLTVVYADPAAKEVRAASLDGATWEDSVVSDGTIGFGLSFAIVDDSAYVAYYTGSGAVGEATWSKGSWDSADVASVDDPDVTKTGDDAANTAVAATSDGTVYVAWEQDGIKVASGKGSFQPVDVGNTVNTGADPALSASEGGVALGWYDTLGQNEMLGLFGDSNDIIVAQPSPSLVPSAASGGGECSGNKAILDETAEGTAFQQTCLIAPAGEPFSITFDNKDSVPHDISIYPSATETTEKDALFYSFDDPNNGGTTNTYKVGPQQPGSYFFQCDFHPTTMTGTFVVSKNVK